MHSTIASRHFHSKRVRKNVNSVIRVFFTGNKYAYPNQNHKFIILQAPMALNTRTSNEMKTKQMKHLFFCIGCIFVFLLQPIRDFISKNGHFVRHKVSVCSYSPYYVPPEPNSIAKVFIVVHPYVLCGYV